MIYPVLRSIYLWLESITDLDIYNYYDSSLDISENYQCNSKTNLPLGTETSFVVVDNITGDDLKNLTYSLKGRYVIFTDSNFNTKNIKITNYNVTTGLITLDEAFGEAVDTSKTFDISFVDTLFIDSGSTYQPYGNKINTDEAVNVYLNLQTKFDSNKEKILDYIHIIERDFYHRAKRIPIYDEDDDIKGYMKCYGSVNIDSKGNFSDQLQKYLVSFTIKYSQNFYKTI